MKYMISWFERPQGSPAEYENAQKRILDVFTQWKAPANFKIEVFVVRVDEWGGHMLVDCDDPLAVHKVCSTFPAFEFQSRRWGRPCFYALRLKRENDIDQLCLVKPASMPRGHRTMSFAVVSNAAVRE